MAEQADSEFDAPSSPHTTDPVAWAALSAASREKADAFLEEQKRLTLEQAVLVRMQTKDLEHDLRLRHWSLRVRHLSDVLKLTFELALAFIVVAVAGFAAVAVWDAVHDHGVVVEAFQVPKDFSDRGITGEALAGDLLSAIAKMQTETDSARPANTYANNWGNDFKVQIADTGLTLGDANRYLHAWLGHQTRISGELWHTADGIAVTVRVGDSRATFQGKEGDRDALVQRAAEAVYAQTQPYRYGTWLLEHDRLDAAEATYKMLAKDASAGERVWANIGLLNASDRRGATRESIALAETALALEPDHPLVSWDLVGEFMWLGHDEDELAALRHETVALKSSSGELSDRAIAQVQHQVFENLALELGDFAPIVGDARAAERLPDYFGYAEQARDNEIYALGLLHDGGGFQARTASLPPVGGDDDAFNRGLAVAGGQFALGDWADSLVNYRLAANAAARVGRIDIVALPVLLWPMQAVAEFETGDRVGGRGLIARTPLDCMMCTIMRGRIDELDGKPDAAAFWYADAARQAPSIPLPLVYWGAMLLHTGHYDAAIAKFTLANQKGPRFADPLELWGEALMQKNRSDLALAKFEEANKYAPNWGRLHLEWGKALYYAGRKGEAKKEIARAAALDLSSADRVAFAQWMKAHE